jgi:hypothetical protein
MGAMQFSHFADDLRSISRICALSVLICASGGCLFSHHSPIPPPSPATTRSPSEVPSVTTRPDGMDASTVNPADLLTQQAESYSQQMAPAIAKHSAGPSAPSQPSLVQWGDASDTHLSLLPGYLLRPKSAPPTPAPIESSVSSANPATAQLASMKSGAIPNSGAVVSAEPVIRQAHAPAAGTSEVPQDGLSDAEGGSSAGRAGETLNALDARLA